ncbi:hypothetical protein ACFPM0_15475 [Pseudonocardia sulfidoxydans]|uniref:hypothetical protein n=1 Tax=Pseudonocardia sulfidoxydans TaxID=54011 RepID=UPI003623939E
MLRAEGRAVTGDGRRHARLGTYAYVAHISEVLIMIAVMVALRAELTSRRGHEPGTREDRSVRA